MEKFLKTWKDISYNNQLIILIAALKEIEKLKIHISKGCLSNLPVGCGSERNESLHECIRKAPSKGRIGVLLALALFHPFFISGMKTKK